MQKRPKSPMDVASVPTTAEVLKQQQKAPPAPASPAPTTVFLPWALATLVAAAALSSASLRRWTLLAVYGMGRMPLIDTFHATCVAFEHRRDADSAQGALQQIVAVLITALGGTTIMNFLLGQPCGWLCDNQTIVPYVVAWLAFCHCPGDLVYRTFAASPSLRLLMGLLDDVSWGVALTKWGFFNAIGAAHESPRDSAVAAILSGTVAGCGGGLTQQAASLLRAEWALRTPDSLRAPLLSMGGFGVKASFCCVCLCYALLDPHGCVREYVPAAWLPPAGASYPLAKEDVVYTAIVVMCCAATVRATAEKALA